MTVSYVDPFGPPWKCGATRLMLQWQGSILQCIGTELIIALSVAVLFMGLWLNRFMSASTDVSEFLDRNTILIHALDYITQRFQAALSMMLGFYTTIMYNRWWRVRNVENDVMSGIKSCSIYVGSYVNTKSNDDQECAASTGLTRDEVVSTMVRWVNLAHAIAVGEIYEKKDNIFFNLGSLVDMGLMTSEEKELLDSSPAKYDLPFRWFADLLDKIVRSENFSLPVPPALAMINTSITRTRSALDNLHMYKTTPVPLAYRQLVNTTVRFYIIILILNEGLAALSLAYEAGAGNPNDHMHSVFWMILPFLFEYFLFVGWLTLADALANPFRQYADELDWEDYVKRTFINSFSLAQMNSRASKGGPLTSKELKAAEGSLVDKRRTTIQEWTSDLQDPRPETCLMTFFGFDKRVS